MSVEKDLDAFNKKIQKALDELVAPKPQNPKTPKPLEVEN